MISSSRSRLWSRSSASLLVRSATTRWPALTDAHTNCSRAPQPGGRDAPDGDRLLPADPRRRSPRLDRKVEVTETGTANGLRIGFSTESEVSGAAEQDWQFYLPCTLYNRNDATVTASRTTSAPTPRTSGTTRTACSVCSPATPSTVDLHGRPNTRPTFDTALTTEQLASRYFVQETDIGSLGLAPPRRPDQPSWQLPVLRGAQLLPRHRPDAVGPRSHPNRPGPIMSVTYEFRIGRSTDLTEAIWELFDRQRDTLGTTRPTPEVTLEESIEHRQLLTQLYYRKWEQAENPKEPAGYLVHFSPRTGETLGSLIEFGFSGDQTLLAYVQTVWGRKNSVPLYVQRARTVIDFFVDHCQLAERVLARHLRPDQRPVHPLVHRHPDALPVRRRTRTTYAATSAVRSPRR